MATRPLTAVVLACWATTLGTALAADTTVTAPRPATTVVSLDGPWMLSPDAKNVGGDEKWFDAVRADAQPTRVPGVLQDTVPDYHGVVWYWREFEAPQNPDAQGRYLLRFWNADYKADVWLNGTSLGGHEGADGVFVLDATAAIRPGKSNLLAVRLLNPKDEPIDGIVLNETPHRNKTQKFNFGSDYNHGGLEDSVELLVVPAARVEDLFVLADGKTGVIHIQANVRNTLGQEAKGHLQFTVAPAAGGEVLKVAEVDRAMPPGDTRVETEIKITNPRPWELHNPYLYRVTSTLCLDGRPMFDEQSARCGFREFRLEDGFFRLNGKRLFLKCTHTGNDAIVGIHVCYDHDFFRRDLLNQKAMGFNAVRFIAGCATPWQLDLCDEIGMMVYEEPYSAWCLANSPKMKERFDRSTVEMIRRDRNHPSVTIWGLLNETDDGPVFRHAVESLPLVRSLDTSRMVLLSSGRFDRQLGIGSVANPGSDRWEFLMGDEHEGGGTTPGKVFAPTTEGMGDFHAYPQVPHSAETVRFLRTLGQGTKPVFVSEYGIASAVDLSCIVRNYEQRGLDQVNAGAYFRQALDKFLADWDRWQLADTFGRPEDYFEQCVTVNGEQRLWGINALRANPNLNGYSMTGAIDHGYSGEGVTKAFREFKPGMFDAVADGFAPLRWCLFAEPVQCYRGASVKLEAVLANEDILPAGEYPVCIQVFGPHAEKVFERKLTAKVPDFNQKPSPAMAIPVFSEEVKADWPSGEYRLIATFERGAAAAGRAAKFYVADPAEMPAVETEVVLWGEDAGLAKWLADHGVRTCPFAAGKQTAREVILASSKPAAPGGAEAFRGLARHIARGSTVVFLAPEIFRNPEKDKDKEKDSTGWLPLAKKGKVVDLPSCIYHKDEWTKRHPIFDGLPCGGLMDYTFYREIIGPKAFTEQEVPTEIVAGGITACPGYSSGLFTSVYKLGAGRFVLNTLQIRQNLGASPVAERLLRNLLRDAARDQDKPLAELPADFDAQLKALGY